MTGKLQPTQLQRLLDAETKNIQSGRYLADHMTSTAVGVIGEDVGPSWLSVLGDLAEYLTENVTAQLNFGVLGNGGTSTQRRLLDAQGFPTWVDVRYTLAAPGSYVPWTSDEDREIKQIVLHSFGQPWHAYEASGEWVGAMNVRGGAEAYIHKNEGVTETVWVPVGTDYSKGFAHWNRLTSTLQALIRSPQGVSGVHFIIDRAGNLYVMGDCNNVMGSSGVLSDTCISIALEEALYAPAVGDAGMEYPATWLSEGDPPGTDGTLQHWDYSTFQYVTLATLIRKLQNGIPTLKTINHSSAVRSVDSSFVGYTMHSHITDAPMNIVDVSPHFQDEDTWTQFFDLVEKQAAADIYATWQKKAGGPAGQLVWVEPIMEALGPEAAGLMKDATTNPAIYTLLGVHRAHQEINKSSSDYRTQAAMLLANESTLQKQKEGVGKIVEVAMAAPVVVPDNDPTIDATSVEDSRNTGVDTEGLYS